MIAHLESTKRLMAAYGLRDALAERAARDQIHLTAYSPPDSAGEVDQLGVLLRMLTGVDRP